ncbi:MAG: Gfo/Idh/MocA family oxidoreductase [Planctomycetes bacterium]|nr:Gfo/Idh/MocA family oxidoreductase [Planctomycetota bacterium]
MRTVRFGIIGGGMMGREFASATARWLHLPEMTIRPEIVAVCNRTLDTPKVDWFKKNIPTLSQVTNDYRALLSNPDVEAVYIAVPHHLHEEFYTAALDAGKHLMGEKPFGIDLKANEAIMAAVRRHPDCFVRCASQFVFFPAVQRIGRMIEAGAFGRIIEVNAGFLHGSDLNPQKPINWKRMIEYNGAYGVMGDLGPHLCTVPFRAGWTPKNVRAVLSKIVRERPDGKGRMVPCETWDNATLLCEAYDGSVGASRVPKRDSSRLGSPPRACPGQPQGAAPTSVFPFTLRTERISPGQKNNWYLEIYGTRASARFSLNEANTLELLEYTPGSEQAWQKISIGHEMTYKSITGEIFQVGVSDAILQMWAAFLYELERGETPGRFAGCATPEESVLWHKLFTAALDSGSQTRCIAFGGPSQASGTTTAIADS